MNQKTLNQIIESGRTVPVTTALMLAVSENAHRQRSEALSSGLSRLRNRIHAIPGKSLNTHH